MKVKKQSTISRREFIGNSIKTSLALAIPTIVPASVFGKNAPSTRIILAAIGTGRISRGHDLPGVWQYNYAQVMAVCDIDSLRAEDGKKLVNDFYTKRDGKPFDGVKVYTDYRELLQNKDIESVYSSIIEIFLEKGLDFISCDRAYNSVNNRYRVSIGKTGALSFQNVRFKVQTSCEAQLAAAHLVKVNLIYPDPCANWNGPEYNIEVTCDDDEVVFSVFNNVVENKPRKTNYNVYVNQFLYYSSKDNQSFMEIPPFGDTIQLRYPANGNTWRLELFQEQYYPFGSLQLDII